MMGRRPPSDGDSSRTTPLPGQCRAIGAQLAESRAARQLSVEEVASKLLLSRGQVLGLEQAEASAFYTPAYFLKGLRKYMTLLDLPDSLLVPPPPDEDEDALRLTFAEPEARPAPRVRLPVSLRAAALAGIATLVLGSVSYRFVTRAPTTADDGDFVSLASSSPLPARPVVLAPAEPPRVQAVPAAALANESDSDGAAVRITVGKATWVFVRYPDNRVLERRLEAGQEIEVGPLPIYLAVGTADEVEVLVEDRRVPLERYTRNGQIRITRPQLAALSDTQAPRE